MSSTGKRSEITNRPGRRGKAFTLAELMVVAVIICVLAGMTLPSLYRATGSTRLRESAMRLAMTGQYARDFAATRRRKCRLLIDANSQSYGLSAQVDPEHQPGKYQVLRSGVGKVERLGEGLRFAKVQIRARGAGAVADLRKRYITFEPTGRSDAAVVTLTDGRRTYSLLVAPHTGNVRLVEGLVNELPDDRLDLDE